MQNIRKMCNDERHVQKCKICKPPLSWWRTAGRAAPAANYAIKALDWCKSLNGQKENAASFFCQCSFDQAVMLAQWYDLRLENQETRVQILPWALASSGYVTVTVVTTLSTSPQHLRSPMLTFANKKLSTGANGQKKDAASPGLLLSAQFWIFWSSCHGYYWIMDVIGWEIQPHCTGSVRDCHIS